MCACNVDLVENLPPEKQPKFSDKPYEKGKMNLSLKQKVLFIGLIVLFFRVFSGCLVIFIYQLAGIPFPLPHFVFEILHAYSPLLACALSVIIALKLLNRISTANVVFIIVIWIIALLPISFQAQITAVNDAPVVAPFNHTKPLPRQVG